MKLAALPLDVRLVLAVRDLRGIRTSSRLRQARQAVPFDPGPLL
jgi:hypothetical protein